MPYGCRPLGNKNVVSSALNILSGFSVAFKKLFLAGKGATPKQLIRQSAFKLLDADEVPEKRQVGCRLMERQNTIITSASKSPTGVGTRNYYVAHTTEVILRTPALKVNYQKVYW